MAYYIKVTPAAAEIIGRAHCGRPLTKDGNVCLHQADMAWFGSLRGDSLRRYAAMCGGLVLTNAEIRQEQSGELCRKLPEPTDPRFANANANAKAADGGSDGEGALS